jgi:hypothetical protein
MITHRLFFSRSNSLQLQAYSDAMWASDLMDRSSLSAYCVSWWFAHCMEDQEIDRSFPFECRGLIIFDAPCLFMHHFLCVLLHFVAFLCIFWN